MRNRILTQKEKNALKRFLNENDTTGALFRVLKMRIKRNHEQLNQDFDLIDHAFKKFQQPPNLTGKPKQKKREG
jgi:hypothetical protein